MTNDELELWCERLESQLKGTKELLQELVEERNEREQKEERRKKIIVDLALGLPI